MMSHIFNVGNRKKLTSEERRRLLAPNETLARLGYAQGLSLADIGCGTGLFTFPASVIGGEAARIFAVDISQDMLDDVRRGIEEMKAKNITTVLCGAYDTRLPDDAADFVLICTVLHEIEDKQRFINEAFRVCRPGGTLAVIEFSETNVGFGPPLDHRLPRDTTGTFLTAAGFSEIEKLDVGEAFYAVKGKKIQGVKS